VGKNNGDTEARSLFFRKKFRMREMAVKEQIELEATGELSCELEATGELSCESESMERCG
jgi:hypothetical protein